MKKSRYRFNLLLIKVGSQSTHFKFNQNEKIIVTFTIACVIMQDSVKVWRIYIET